MLKQAAKRMLPTRVLNIARRILVTLKADKPSMTWQSDLDRSAEERMREMFRDHAASEREHDRWHKARSSVSAFVCGVIVGAVAIAIAFWLFI